MSDLTFYVPIMVLASHRVWCKKHEQALMYIFKTKTGFRAICQMCEEELATQNRLYRNRIVDEKGNIVIEEAGQG